MSFYVVDVEANGPIPGEYSMLSFAAVRVDDKLETIFKSGNLWAISKNYDPGAIHAIGLTKEDYETFHVHGGSSPHNAMKEFAIFIRDTNEEGRPIFFSDNNGFDWMFICWYFHYFLHTNPFGYSSRRIGDLYCGLHKNLRAKWKHLRKTQHTHRPEDDAKGNAEVLITIIKEMQNETQK